MKQQSGSNNISNWAIVLLLLGRCGDSGDGGDGDGRGDCPTTSGLKLCRQCRLGLSRCMLTSGTEDSGSYQSSFHKDAHYHLCSLRNKRVSVLFLVQDDDVFLQAVNAIQ
ncbi:hypothetical protein TYRP_010003 [Tyrophagus putrescentiae]|nr:hypothetical protein TYRP_010003 [Tyrophagus putrescentiae]